MSTLEIKGNILQLLARIDNLNHLTKLQKIVEDFAEQKNDIEGYAELSIAQKDDLLEAIADTYDETQLISHNEVSKKIGKWLAK